ncbi:hypothetical protein A264_04197 [Pseudomonas syringae pv. actinidiae ICMP 19071]|uniref:hypothetical protein n=1 Tax=Pseudomonas syringae TaxID=317 RepID=UPI0003579D98|nr:hypothetical protein [Pseudomonas syringae]EPM62153.1 hypothetical protein A264_04197 [Pseudomonas syringae pv. actinidiae ICMP 19071]EPM79896.1 hypothetical protein A3SO_04211 [Pseudomonas syringae pv. actinidiae ICMP 19072]OSN69063.1 hypothetical protein BV349_00701 [Pseudomonas syringae pv. actinidiae]OSN79256.1 hypothetical protein BV351_00700 [Pseudomonas syringae pv. actinidiae]RMS15447.1 hypothetical protein ALP75_201834 [Pseudomonas syringae pv. actinidiae]
MSPHKLFAGLNIESSGASPGDANFLPGAWPPAPDFPICIDAEGVVTARFGDEVWDLTPWAGFRLNLNFGKSKRKNGGNIDAANSFVFRVLIAFWLYGPRPTKEIRTLKSLYEVARPLFVFCTSNKIVASDFHRFPLAIESYAKNCANSQTDTLILKLHSLWEHRDLAGFYILDQNGLVALQKATPEHIQSQTAYIPPRIWLYQLSRLRLFLEEFRDHMDALEACFSYCIDAYIENSGSMHEACKANLPRYWRPFAAIDEQRNGKFTNAKNFGLFQDTAKSFGLYDLFDRWCGDIAHQSISIFSTYFNMASMVGKAYILNFTLMRIDEASSLRSGCLSSEKCPITDEEIFLIKGVTTKTVDDDDACWITSPSSALAVEVMQFVSRLRMKCAAHIRTFSIAQEDVDDPYLELRPYEPWRRQPRFDSAPDVRLNDMSYSSMMLRFPKLFDERELTIQVGDLQNALLVTPTLDPIKYAIGLPWPLAWHQLRRTGAVNMSASGIVGESGVQYQLKHSSRMMTRYYGNGHYHLSSNLNQEAKAEYIRAMYEMVARSFASLVSDRFVSPHGNKRKEQIINVVNITDHQSLLKSAKNGSIAYREIIFGSCSNPKPCPYGGIDHVAKCGGGDGSQPCPELLIDREKEPVIRKVGELLRKRLDAAEKDSPLYTSLQYQLTAVQRTLDVITD